MIPDPALLRHEAAEAWKLSSGEDEFRRTFVASWGERINAARHAREIDNEGMRLAYVAVLSPIPYRRRFNHRERMKESAAIVALFDLGVPCRSSEQVAHHAMPDLPYVRDIAAEYGITIIDDDDDEDEDDDDEAEAKEPWLHDEDDLAS